MFGLEYRHGRHDLFHTKVVEALGGPKIDVPTGRKDVTMEDAENRLPDGSWSG